jgi:protein-disulfide reductase (glutathione)
MLHIFFVCLFFTISLSTDYSSRGLPLSISWQSYESALDAAKTSGKPTMVVFTKTWCGACKNLKSDLILNEENFRPVSEKFQMVSIEEDNETPTDGKNFNPDGGYIPRVFFLDPQGNIDDTMVGGNANYKHYFASTDALIKAMNQFADKISQNKDL